MSDFLPVPSEQEWTESDRQWFELVRSLRSQVVRLQTTISTLIAERDELRDRYAPRCGETILADSAGKVYGCGKLRGHDGAHETIEERRRTNITQKPEEEAKP